MNRDDLRAHCLSKPAAVETFPFGPETAVFKVMNKVFALLPVTEGDHLYISLKCDPILAEMLRRTYKAITPAWHLNKRHWNGVAMDGSVPDDEVRSMIDHSYEQVVKGLTRAQRKSLERQGG